MTLQGPSSRTRDCFSRRRTLKELLHSEGDDSGYIEGKVFMVWPPRNGSHRINLEVVEDTTLYRFEVEVPHNDGIAFRSHERVFLALKGMKIDQRKESNAPHGVPIILRFVDGVVLKYVSGANAGKVVDTWEGSTDEWFNPGIVHTVSDAVTTDASGIQRAPVATTTHSPMSTPQQSDIADRRDEGVKANRPTPPLIAIADDTYTTQSMRPVLQPRTESSTRALKAKQRKRRKLRKEKESTLIDQLTNDSDKLPLANATMSCHERQQPQNLLRGSFINASDNGPNLHHVKGQSTGAASIREHHEGYPPLSRESNQSKTMTISGEVSAPTLQLKTGVRTERGDTFTTLSDLQKGYSMINIIGIVTFVNQEKKTRTNEWSRSFTLVDPSIVDTPRQAVTVNCFQKKYLEWLPQVQKDDIVILRKLKVVEFNGVVTATGYSDKLRWAVYDPPKHSIRPPNKGSAPEKELIDDGMGYEFSPYWEPFEDSTELEYCRKIGEWWKARHTLEGQNASMVQCTGARKQHLLISEASPDLPPKGFFNCTIEVLQKFSNHGGATTVYVTDYTVNPLVYPVQASWCPPELSGCVLQCDMWDDARNIANMMKPGEYWYLHNVRAKWNPSNYMEGTMQLAEKVIPLDETNLETQPHLRALLTRKCEFESNKSSLTSGSGSLHIFPEMFLQDVDEATSFFTCTVELLRNNLNSRDGHFIYVTDYTYNADLPTIVATADWALSLEHRVLKIKLDDTQAKVASEFQPGSMLIIHNLRCRRVNTSGGILACLGGKDLLILRLNDSSSPHAQKLQRNKETWKRENMLDGMMALSSVSHVKGSELPKQLSTSLHTTLQEVCTRPAPDVFTVLARAVDFFPFSLEDACILRCTKCESSPPPSFKRCPRCDDMMNTHSKWFYRVYILLQDEKGGELIVSLSGKECTLLQDVDPMDFHCDHVAFRRFLAKLNPILGNLEDVHVSWSRNEHRVIESPFMVFTIESWNVGDKVGYSLLDCTRYEASR